MRHCGTKAVTAALLLLTLRSAMAPAEMARELSQDEALGAFLRAAGLQPGLTSGRRAVRRPGLCAADCGGDGAAVLAAPRRRVTPSSASLQVKARSPPISRCPAANLEARRVDTRNSTYRHATVDLSFPAPGCGAGPWDGLPPGHAAQPVDLQVAGPVLTRLGLPASWDGAPLPHCVRSRRSLRPKATAPCLGERTWARTSAAARCGAARRRTRRWRRAGMTWRWRRRCGEAGAWKQGL